MNSKTHNSHTVTREQKSITVIAPGRTCLFGDHQDYLNLPVITCAINRYITLRAVSNGTKTLRVNLPDINTKRLISIAPDAGEIEPGDHFRSALSVLSRYGCVPTEGYDIHITGNIAINAGISSSTALVVAWIRFLLEAFGSASLTTPELVSRIAYEAEVTEHGDPGGRMDQYSIGLGNIIYLETDSSANYQIFNRELEGLIIGASGIPKQTVAVLSELKGGALAAISTIKEQVPDFNIVTVRLSELRHYLAMLPEDLGNYLEAAVLNHHITQQARSAFQQAEWNLPVIGQLMNEHHAVLRDKLKLTVPRIDAMIDAALTAGALGAKIVGSGRGGSIVALAPPNNTQRVIGAIKKAGAKDAYAVSVDPGARVTTNEIHQVQ